MKSWKLEECGHQKVLRDILDGKTDSKYERTLAVSKDLKIRTVIAQYGRHLSLKTQYKLADDKSRKVIRSLSQNPYAHDEVLIYLINNDHQYETAVSSNPRLSPEVIDVLLESHDDVIISRMYGGRITEKMADFVKYSPCELDYSITFLMRSPYASDHIIQDVLNWTSTVLMEDIIEKGEPSMWALYWLGQVKDPKISAMAKKHPNYGDYMKAFMDKLQRVKDHQEEQIRLYGRIF